jgi:hypothetical protein
VDVLRKLYGQKKKGKMPDLGRLKGAIGAFYGAGGALGGSVWKQKKLREKAFGLSPLRGKELRNEALSFSPLFRPYFFASRK